MQDGLYKIEFRVGSGTGYGLICAQGGRLWGGDAILYYTGTYTISDGKVTANVQTARHSNVPGMVPLFGRDQVNITLQGTVAGNGGTLTGTAKEAPGTFHTTLSRLSD